MAHEPGHPIPIDLDFTIEITPPSLPPIKPPKMPKGCFSLDLPVGGIMGFIRSEMVRLEAHIRSQVEGVYDQVESQIYEKIPEPEEIVEYLMGYGCEFELEVTDFYNRLKASLQIVYKTIEGLKAKIDEAIKTIDTLKGKTSQVEEVLSKLTEPLDLLAGVISAAKIAINLLPPGPAAPPAAVMFLLERKLTKAASTVCVMNGNVSGIPQSLRVQVERLTEQTKIINPYIGKLNELVAKVQELEAVLEVAYIEWLADCIPGDEVPPVNPLKDYYRIKIYEAITNNVDQFPSTNIDDWYEVSNEISKVIPPTPDQWLSSQNYQIADQAMIVTGPPPDETTGKYLIKYYAAIKNNLNHYPEISLNDWNLLRAINVDEIPEDNTPEWDGNIDYIVEDVVKIIIDLSEGSFNQTISNIVNAQGPEMIEKLYNANFRMIGYKRYRV